MKKATAIILSAIMLLMCTPVFAAQMAQRSSVRAFIDYTPIDSYVIDGYTYINAEELGNYGFEVAYDDVTRSLNVSRIKFATPMYTREMWEKSTVMQTGAEIGESDIDVYLDGERTDSYFVDGKLLITIDSLCKYGSFYWDEELKQVSVTIFQDELQRELDNAEGVVEIEYEAQKGYLLGGKGTVRYTGQVDENGVPNGIGMSEYEDETKTKIKYLGYFKDGNPDGYVYKSTWRYVWKSYTYRYIDFIGTIDGSRESKRDYVTFESGGTMLKTEPNFGSITLPIMEFTEFSGGPTYYPDVDIYVKGVYLERKDALLGGVDYDCSGVESEYRIWHDGDEIWTITDMDNGAYARSNVHDAGYADKLNWKKDNVVAMSHFYEYAGNEQTVYDGAVHTVSEKNGETVLNDAAVGGGRYPLRISVMINGKSVGFERELPHYYHHFEGFSISPVILNDRILVPIRVISENLGAKVSWEDSTKTAILKKSGKTIELQIDNEEMEIDDKAVRLDCVPQIFNDRTYVPLRAVSEAFDAQVEWNGDLKTVGITTE